MKKTSILFGVLILLALSLLVTECDNGNTQQETKQVQDTNFCKILIL